MSMMCCAPEVHDPAQCRGEHHEHPCRVRLPAHEVLRIRPAITSQRRLRSHLPDNALFTSATDTGFFFPSFTRAPTPV